MADGVRDGTPETGTIAGQGFYIAPARESILSMWPRQDTPFHLQTVC